MDGDHGPFEQELEEVDPANVVRVRESLLIHDHNLWARSDDAAK